MENETRDESNGGPESVRRRGGRREVWEDIMQRGPGEMGREGRQWTGEEKMKERRRRGSLKSSNDLLIDEGPKL